MFEEGLLRAQVVLAVLTEESAKRPWVIWETATAWAREALLIPIFVDVMPGSIEGPLTLKVQGVPYNDAAKLDRAFNRIADRLSRPRPLAVTPAEVTALIRSTAPL
jgi:hypothetical protein